MIPFLIFMIVGLAITVAIVLADNSDIRDSRDYWRNEYDFLHERHMQNIRSQNEFAALMKARLNAVCADLTPSPIEIMSDEQAQQLVDTFNNSQYRN